MSSNPKRGSSTRSRTRSWHCRLVKVARVGLFSVVFFLVQGLGPESRQHGRLRRNQVNSSKGELSFQHKMLGLAFAKSLYCLCSWVETYGNAKSGLSNGSRETLPNSRVNLLA